MYIKIGNVYVDPNEITMTYLRPWGEHTSYDIGIIDTTKTRYRFGKFTHDQDGALDRLRRFIKMLHFQTNTRYIYLPTPDYLWAFINAKHIVNVSDVIEFGKYFNVSLRGGKELKSLVFKTKKTGRSQLKLFLKSWHSDVMLKTY